MDELRVKARRAGEAQDQIIVGVSTYKDGKLVSQKDVEFAADLPDQMHAKALAELGKMTGVNITMRVLAGLLDG